MNSRSNPIRTAAVIGAVAWFLLVNGVAVIHDQVLGLAKGAQMGWGTTACYASVFLAPVAAGLGAFVGTLASGRRSDAGGSKDEESW